MLLKKSTYIILLLFTMISPALRAGDSLSVPKIYTEELKDRTARIPESSFFDDYRNDKAYNYGQDFKPPKNSSIFNRLWKRFLKLLGIAIKALHYLPLVFRIAVIALGVFLLYLLIAKTKMYKLFYTDREVPDSEFTEVDQFDEEYDFEKAIAGFLQQQNFRNALRLLHRKILKELELLDIIKLGKEKTNRDYAKEIKNSDLRNSFFVLTGIYNRVWYGNYPLKKNEYEVFANDFTKFSIELNAKKK